MNISIKQFGFLRVFYINEVFLKIQTYIFFYWLKTYIKVIHLVLRFLRFTLRFFFFLILNNHKLHKIDWLSWTFLALMGKKGTRRFLVFCNLSGLLQGFTFPTWLLDLDINDFLKLFMDRYTSYLVFILLQIVVYLMILEKIFYMFNHLNIVQS